MNEKPSTGGEGWLFPQYRDLIQVEGKEYQTSPIFLFPYVATYSCFPQNLLSPHALLQS